LTLDPVGRVFAAFFKGPPCLFYFHQLLHVGAFLAIWKRNLKYPAPGEEVAAGLEFTEVLQGNGKGRTTWFLFWHKGLFFSLSCNSYNYYSTNATHSINSTYKNKITRLQHCELINSLARCLVYPQHFSFSQTVTRVSIKQLDYELRPRQLSRIEIESE